MKFKDVYHLYLGCECMTSRGVETIVEVRTLYHPIVVHSDKFGWIKLTQNEVKPILKRIDNLPIKELDKIMAMHSFEAAKLGYDMFGLIDSGEAVDVETLNNGK